MTRLGLAYTFAAEPLPAAPVVVRAALTSPTSQQRAAPPAGFPGRRGLRSPRRAPSHALGAHTLAAGRFEHLSARRPSSLRFGRRTDPVDARANLVGKGCNPRRMPRGQASPRLRALGVLLHKHPVARGEHCFADHLNDPAVDPCNSVLPTLLHLPTPSVCVPVRHGFNS